MVFLVFFFFIFLLIDAALLKKRSPQRFTDAFFIDKSWGVLLAGLLIIVLAFSDQKVKDTASLTIVVIAPLYFLRRSRLACPLEMPAATEVVNVLSQAAEVVATWLYGMIVLGHFLGAVTALWPSLLSELGEMVFSSVVSNAWAMVLIYRSVKAMSFAGFWERVGFKKGARRWLREVWVPAAVGLFFAFFAASLLTARQVHPSTPLSEALESSESAGLLAVVFFLALVAAPFVEEIIFRGYFFHVFRTWLGPAAAIYVLGLTFAVLHVGQYWGDWTAILVVTLLGLTMTGLRAWAGTTLASVVTHYVYNIGVTIVPVIMLAVSNPPYFKYNIYYNHYDSLQKEKLLRESLIVKPDLADAYNDLAWLYADEKKNLEEALDLAARALSFAPDHPAYLDTKAYVLEQMGRQQEAAVIRRQLRE